MFIIEFTTSCDAKLDVFLSEMAEFDRSLVRFWGIFFGYLAVLGSTLHVKGVRRSTFSKSFAGQGSVPIDLGRA